MTIRRLLLAAALCLVGATFATDAEACEKTDKAHLKAKGGTTVEAAATALPTATDHPTADGATCEKCGKGEKCSCAKEKCSCEACKKPAKMTQADCKCEKGGKNCTCKKGECKCANCGGKRTASGGELALAD